ncbi:putative membrane protein [Halorhabdus sp. SVX81]|uniref:metal-dependent hydrolase n=1 Tax=Halorhabdus sp. SVX81 TaxID=2978283 RepID=UPI0023DA55D1|nr:metal-dependent hydrolase [Halorhabdus sp. SVX81]WEL17920.1 putative membrane protein [Halorhabdus sp. SVX81]
MFVGHAFLAFGIVALLARRFGPAERLSLRGVTVQYAVVAGLAAALFASLPDVDVAHAAFQVVTLPEGATAFDHFWTATGERHRTTTHSLVVAVLASAGFAVSVPNRWGGAAVLFGVVALAAFTGGVVGAGVMTLFVVGGVALTALAARIGLSARSIFGASALGLAIHPFTDLLTGVPPSFFAPWDVTVIGGRVEPFTDATYNLLVAFGTEIAVIWFGLLVGLTLLGIELRRHVHPAGVLGVAYAPMALVLNAPSVDNAALFVGTILPVGAIGLVGVKRQLTGARVVTITLTALAAITAAWFGFGVAYTFIS